MQSTALERQIQVLRERNREIAIGGLRAIDALSREVSPHLLQDIQDEIRGGLLWAEEQLRRSAARAKHWRTIRGRRFQCIPHLSARRAKRLPLVHERDELLVRQRNIFRQLGDACAWIVLKYDARLIRMLYAQGRSHHLTTDGIGLIGPAVIAEKAHMSGRYLVIENDLTRCLGIGDLTVVRFASQWVRPLSVEVKTSGTFEEGETATVGLYLALSDHPLDTELYENFAAAVGVEAEATEIPPNAAQQVEEIKARAEVILKSSTARMRSLARPRRSHWSALEGVLKRAQGGRYAYDSLEPGVACAAIRMRPGDDPANAFDYVLSELTGVGTGPGRQSLYGD